MNLLKVLMLVCLAASLSLLIPVTVHASDHPWDDNTVDTTFLQGGATIAKEDAAGNTPKPVVDIPIIQRISIWAHGWLREVRQIFSGQDKQETKGTVIDKNKRPETPVAFRKHNNRQS
jgi:hypothetical protein